jgi:hypothetical protein
MEYNNAKKRIKSEMTSEKQYVKPLIDGNTTIKCIKKLGILIKICNALFGDEEKKFKDVMKNMSIAVYWETMNNNDGNIPIVNILSKKINLLEKLIKNYNEIKRFAQKKDMITDIIFYFAEKTLKKTLLKIFLPDNKNISFKKVIVLKSNLVKRKRELGGLDYSEGTWHM